MESFPVRRVITRADFADKNAWMHTRKGHLSDHEFGTVRVLAVHGDFYLEERGGFPGSLYAQAQAVSFVDVSVRSLELSFILDEPGTSSQLARFGFACSTNDPLYAAGAHLTNLFPELERYVAVLLGRRFGYRHHRVGHAELQTMLLEYGTIRPPAIRGIRARLSYLDFVPEADGRKGAIVDDARL